jgi:hypothetical protein
MKLPGYLADINLPDKMLKLIHAFENWAPRKSSVYAAPGGPIGTVGEYESSLYVDTHNGHLYYASEGRPWRVIGNLKGPQGDPGPTGPTGPCWRECHDKCHDKCRDKCDDGCNRDRHHGRDRNYGRDRHDDYRKHMWDDNSCNDGYSCDDYSPVPYKGNRRDCGYDLDDPNCCPPQYYQHSRHSMQNHHRPMIFPRVVQGEAVSITPPSLNESVITLTVIPQRPAASLDISFCGSFTNSSGQMVDYAGVPGKVVVTGSTGSQSISLTVDFISGQAKWSGSFFRQICLIPGSTNKIYINVGFQSDGNATGITLMGINDFISSRLMYDI